MGQRLSHSETAPGAILTSEDEVIRVITKVIDVYKANGNKGERFADTVERVGFDKISSEILGK